MGIFTDFLKITGIWSQLHIGDKHAGMILAGWDGKGSFVRPYVVLPEESRISPDPRRARGSNTSDASSNGQALSAYHREQMIRQHFGSDYNPRLPFADRYSSPKLAYLLD